MQIDRGERVLEWLRVFFNPTKELGIEWYSGRSIDMFEWVSYVNGSQTVVHSFEQPIV